MGALRLSRVLLGGAALGLLVETVGLVLRFADRELIATPFLPGSPAVSFAVAAPLLASWMVAGVAFTMGRGVTLAGTVLSLCVWATLLWDQQLYSNHRYLIGVLVPLSTLATSGRRWAVTLMKTQVSVVYFFAALTKINAGFLLGFVLARAATGLDRVPWWVHSGLAVMVVTTEFWLTIALWRTTTRRVAWTIGILLHLAFAAMMPAFTFQLLVFGLGMIAVYPLFSDHGQTVEVQA